MKVTCNPTPNLIRVDHRRWFGLGSFRPICHCYTCCGPFGVLEVEELDDFFARCRSCGQFYDYSPPGHVRPPLPAVSKVVSRLRPNGTLSRHVCPLTEADNQLDFNFEENL